MKLFNTLTKKLDEVKPVNGDIIRIYSCGPTVYDHIHIGNLSSFIFADMLRRALKITGSKVKHVMNFTDVDDKTIRASQAESKDSDPVAALKSLTKKYELLFIEDMQKIGNSTSDISFIRATDHIKEMQELIRKLYDAGFAYIANDGVYFSISKYRSSGKKYGQLLEITAESTADARINNDEYDKDNIHDFALWKLHKENEPAWEFNLDGQHLSGRPGWHIECSAMSSEALGLPFDIHTGGIDLIFPHHENEIAQSTANENSEIMATVFAHNEHLLIDGKKMSKSLNNFYTLGDLGQKGFEPLAFRLLMLQSHYRSQTNFTWESLAAAQNRLNELRGWADLRHQSSLGTINNIQNLLKETKDKIISATDNDLNTPMAIAELNSLVSQMEGNPLNSEQNAMFTDMLNFLDELFGLNLSQSKDISEEQKQLIKQRELARQSKDWAKSDAIRNELEADGIAVRDADFGTVWSRINTTN